MSKRNGLSMRGRKVPKAGGGLDDMVEDMVKDVTTLYSNGKKKAEDYLVDFARTHVAPLVEKGLVLSPNSKFDPETFEIYEVLSDDSTSTSFSHLLVPAYDTNGEVENGGMKLTFSGDFTYATLETCESGLCSYFEECDDNEEDNTVYTDYTDGFTYYASFDNYDNFTVDDASYDTASLATGSIGTYGENSVVITNRDKYRNMDIDDQSVQSVQTMCTKELHNDSDHVSDNLQIIKKRRLRLRRRARLVSEISMASLASMAVSSGADRYIHAFPKSDGKGMKWNVTMPIIGQDAVELKALTMDEDDKALDPCNVDDKDPKMALELRGLVSSKVEARNSSYRKLTVEPIPEEDENLDRSLCSPRNAPVEVLDDDRQDAVSIPLSRCDNKNSDSEFDIVAIQGESEGLDSQDSGCVQKNVGRSYPEVEPQIGAEVGSETLVSIESSVDFDIKNALSGMKSVSTVETNNLTITQMNTEDDISHCTVDTSGTVEPPEIEQVTQENNNRSLAIPTKSGHGWCNSHHQSHTSSNWGDPCTLCADEAEALHYSEQIVMAQPTKSFYTMTTVTSYYEPDSEAIELKDNTGTEDFSFTGEENRLRKVYYISSSEEEGESDEGESEAVEVTDEALLVRNNISSSHKKDAENTNLSPVSKEPQKQQMKYLSPLRYKRLKKKENWRPRETEQKRKIPTPQRAVSRRIIFHHDSDKKPILITGLLSERKNHDTQVALNGFTKNQFVKQKQISAVKHEMRQAKISAQIAAERQQKVRLERRKNGPLKKSHRKIDQKQKRSSKEQTESTEQSNELARRTQARDSSFTERTTGNRYRIKANGYHHKQPNNSDHVVKARVRRTVSRKKMGNGLNKAAGDANNNHDDEGSIATKFTYGTLGTQGTGNTQYVARVGVGLGSNKQLTKGNVVLLTTSNMKKHLRAAQR